MTKPTKWHVRPAKTQISLGIRPVWSESLLCAQWVAKDPSFLHADSKDSDQTRRMPRLILVFAGRTLILLVLSWGSSHYSWCSSIVIILREWWSLHGCSWITDWSHQYFLVVQQVSFRYIYFRKYHYIKYIGLTFTKSLRIGDNLELLWRYADR